MEKYLNDSLTVESERKSDELAKVDLMPEAIKNWYVRNNVKSQLVPIEYKNDEIGEVWDMVKLEDNYPMLPKRKDTNSIPPTNPSSLRNDSAALIPKKKKENSPK
jgi:hypothetical protein